MSKYYQGSGINSNNDTAREASSARGRKNYINSTIFGGASNNRKEYLEKYQWSMSWSEYKKMKTKNYYKRKRKNKKKSKMKLKKRFKGNFR